MEKRVLVFAFLLIGLVVVSGLAIAQNESEDESGGDDDIEEELDLSGVDKAYSCLENEVDEKDSFSLQESVFGVLALGSEDKLEDVIENEKKSGEDCWPKSGCNLRETAQVLLAYDRIGKSTDDIEDWLLSKNGTADELTWYLEVEVTNHVASECTVKYNGDERSIDVREDFTLSGSGGSCLSVSSSGYWLKIDDDCLEEEFEVSCDEDFITTLIYQKGLSGTLFVSSETHSAPSLGTTTEKVNAQCFKSGNSCDYEGSLWAALALHEVGKETSEFIPYLLALAPDNKKYFPESFLYILGVEDQYGSVAEQQKQGDYWQMGGSPYNRFYDTSLGMLSLQGSGASELGNSQSYLLEVQTKEGCWNNNNIRDTAFVLYSGWPRGVSTSGGGGTVGQSCTSSGNYCEREGACLDSGGLVLGELECSNFRDVCCNVRIVESTCFEQGGRICGAGEQCSGDITSSADGSCCLGTCEIREVTDVCASGGGMCRVSCDEDDEITGDACPIAGDVCCKTSSEPSGGISAWVWILLLLILIALVVLGIVYRNKLRVFIYRWKGKIKTQKIERPRGGPGIPVGMRRAIPRFSPAGRPVRRAPRRRTGGRGDRELEETMRKLKEMSK